jgi:hypothetical protein
MPLLRLPLYVLFAFLLFNYGCSTGAYQYEDEHYRIKQVAQMPTPVDEGSGLARAKDGRSFWTLNDGGGGTELFQVSPQGQLLRTLRLQGVRNIDWEELAQDTSGHLYVGDVGNNWNVRRHLKIYRVDPDQPQRIAPISFRYPDQQKFPPDRMHKSFDCEAFFWHKDSLYLFSKNRGDKQVKIYVIPATPGDYVARIADRTYLEPDQHPSDQEIQVTAADISPDGKTFALLTYGNIYLFEVHNCQINFQRPLWAIRMDVDGVEQVEALTFVNNTGFVFTNEEGRIFEARKK